MNIIEKAEELRGDERFWEYLYRYGITVETGGKTYTTNFGQPITDEVGAREFCSFCQSIWEALPDSPHIRTYEFFRICDLAELHMFGE